MSIIRGPRPNGDFYILNRGIAEDERLSWSARGLLIFLLVKPDHWQISVAHLKKQTEAARIKTGRDGIYALLAELQSAGYITRGQQRRQGDGTLGEADYIVSETPVPPEPHAAEPCTAEPHTAETTVVNTQCKQESTDAKAPTAPRSTPPMKIAAVDPETGLHFLFGLNSGLEWQLAQDDYDEMRRLYPAVDVAAELRKARGWLIGNPTKRKTERGILRFLHTWLARAQDRGGNTHAAVQGRGGMSVADRVRARADANDRARGADFDQHWFGRTIEHEA